MFDMGCAEAHRPFATGVGVTPTYLISICPKKRAGWIAVKDFP